MAEKGIEENSEIFRKAICQTGTMDKKEKRRCEKETMRSEGKTKESQRAKEGKGWQQEKRKEKKEYESEVVSQWGESQQF